MPKNLVFYTFFSEGYLPHAHVLLTSIYDIYPKARVIACNLDSGATRINEFFPLLEMVAFDQVKESDPELNEVLKHKEGASSIFTSAPSIALHVLAKIDPGSALIYLDADTALLNGVEPILKELNNKDFGLFPHRFSGILSKFLLRYGKFNAGAFIVRNSDSGKNFLNEWRRKCLEWCDDRLDGEKYSNQGYLTGLEGTFRDSSISLANSSGNVAPWNAGFWNTNVMNHNPTFKKKPIVFFHFHGLTKSNRGWEISHLRYGKWVKANVLRAIYINYINSLTAASQIYSVKLKRSDRFENTGLNLLVDSALWVLSTFTFQFIPNKWLKSENPKMK